MFLIMGKAYIATREGHKHSCISILQGYPYPIGFHSSCWGLDVLSLSYGLLMSFLWALKEGLCCPSAAGTTEIRSYPPPPPPSEKPSLRVDRKEFAGELEERFGQQSSGGQAKRCMLYLFCSCFFVLFCLLPLALVR